MGWKKDEFDDENDPRFKAVAANLLAALDIRDRIGARSPLFAAAMLAVTLSVLVGVLWYSYPKEAAEQELRAVAIVRADAGPIKMIPGDPGGMDIPHRDSTVFDTLRAADEKSGGDRIENLLPEPEKPMPRTEMFAGLKTDLEISSPSVLPAPAAKSEKQEIKKEESTEASKIEPAAGTPKKEIKKEGGYYIQLGSLKSRAEAEKTWKASQSAFPDQLGGLDLRVQEASVGAKGTFYRVQGGPVDQASARSICKAVEAKKPGGCLVVGR